MSSVSRLSTNAFRQVAARQASKRTGQIMIIRDSSGHGGLHPVNGRFPFTYDNKRTFAVKALVFFGTSFTVPFIAIWWHWNRPGGLNNP